MQLCLPALAAIALLSATPAAAVVVGDAQGNLFFNFDENSDLAVTLAYPASFFHFTSSGEVHEDGFDDTGFVDTEYQEIMLGLWIYSFAFSKPDVDTLASSTVGIQGLTDGVFATISNPTAFSQTVRFSVSSTLSIWFSGKQAFDRFSGQIGYRLRGRGDAEAINFGSFVRVPPTRADGVNLREVRGYNFSFSLAPGGNYQLSIHDYVARINLHASAVPEPAMWLQLIAGFAGVGVALRARRGAVSSLSRGRLAQDRSAGRSPLRRPNPSGASMGFAHALP